MLRLEIQAANSKEMQAQINDLGSGGLIAYSDEGLLSEVRQRMAAKGLVVKVVPFDDGTSADDNASTDVPVPTTEKEKGKPGRKTKVTEPPSRFPLGAMEEPKPIDPASDTAKTTAETTPATIDDVKKALDAFAAVKGQVEARAKIQAIGGAPRLMDVPPDKFGALIEALKLAA